MIKTISFLFLIMLNSLVYSQTKTKDTIFDFDELSEEQIYSIQNNTVLINGHSVEFITTVFNDTLQAEILNININNNKVITHTLSHFDGDCSSENIELGSYEIKDNSIILFSYWAGGDRMGRNVYPFGFRKQIYSVAKDGKIALINSSIYLEAYVDSYQVHEGIKFLNKKPTTEVEQRLLKDYIIKAEKRYLGNFVLGVKKEILEKEVRTKLKSEIKNNTKNWKEIYNGNFNN